MEYFVAICALAAFVGFLIYTAQKKKPNGDGSGGSAGPQSRPDKK